jgi:hypothetical protein
VVFLIMFALWIALCGRVLIKTGSLSAPGCDEQERRQLRLARGMLLLAMIVALIGLGVEGKSSLIVMSRTLPYPM